MLSTTYTFSARQARDLLESLERGVGDLKPLVERWLAYYREVAQPAIFAAHEHAAESGGGGHGHPAWAALSALYVASKVKRTSPHPKDILQLSGDFKADLTVGTSFTFQHIAESNGNLEARFGTTREYPVWAGAAAGGPRQAMYLTGSTLRELDAITNHFISDLIVKERERVQAATDVGESAARARYGLSDGGGPL